MEQAIEVKKCVGPLHRGLFIAKAEFGKNQKACRSCKREYSQKRYAAKKTEILAYGRAWKSNNKERCKTYNNLWSKDNLERRRQSSHKHQIKIEVRLMKSVIRRLLREIGLLIQRPNVPEWLGCSIPEYIVYLQGKFTPGMNWINYGKGKRVWEIDHYMPVCAFDKTEEGMKKALHYTNTRPLWSRLNKLKGSKIPPLPLAA